MWAAVPAWARRGWGASGTSRVLASEPRWLPEPEEERRGRARAAAASGAPLMWTRALDGRGRCVPGRLQERGGAGEA